MNRKVFRDDNGKILYFVTYDDNDLNRAKMHGRAMSLWGNGLLREESFFVNDKMHGSTKHWDVNGNLMYSAYRKHGKLHGREWSMLDTDQISYHHEGSNVTEQVFSYIEGKHPTNDEILQIKLMFGFDLKVNNE